ncbi:hypothetical protein [Hoeflea sp. TYP-13]|uniref:hypothetical protein n=1 Tax=Hoeflea sp. TYP-13 TaxID=3230023 RepID=UPI0034C5D6C9
MSKGRRSAFNTPEILEQLEKGRKGALAVMAGSPPFRDRYKKALAITEAIDELTEELTGDREHFWEQVRR